MGEELKHSSVFELRGSSDFFYLNNYVGFIFYISSFNPTYILNRPLISEKGCSSSTMESMKIWSLWMKHGWFYELKTTLLIKTFRWKRGK